jgi:uncharacterized membrane protein YqaE (UPF0057 family)
MRYLFAFVFPPLAVLLCGKPWQCLFVSIPLTLLFVLPGIIHAVAVVSAYNADNRTDKLVRAIQTGTLQPVQAPAGNRPAIRIIKRKR